MGMRYFTLEEANALLPELSPLVGRLLELRARVSHNSRAIGEVLSDLRSDVGGPGASRLVKEFEEIESLVNRIQSYGCVMKSLEAGLLDFLCERDGRDVFLCWRYGESAIMYFHELHSGYQGRQPV
jgi:hypothetical protein